MKKLDFIIVGAMKAGTSSLAFHLSNHPNICMPLKEAHFFNIKDHYEQGSEYYKIFFKDCESKKLWGEKTPTYSYLRKVAPLIKEYNPDIKLIWILRNPVKRSYSNYWHAFKKGVEDLSFKKA